jgi:hypothetical protein
LSAAANCAINIGVGLLFEDGCDRASWDSRSTNNQAFPAAPNGLFALDGEHADIVSIDDGHSAPVRREGDSQRVRPHLNGFFVVICATRIPEVERRQRLERQELSTWIPREATCAARVPPGSFKAGHDGRKSLYSDVLSKVVSSGHSGRQAAARSEANSSCQ